MNILSVTPRIAVIGSGIAGLACAHALVQSGHRVTLFEAGSHFGGHTHTIDVTLDGITHPVDTGFLVFNERTYPKLISLFTALGVPVAKSEMSFSVSLGGARREIEWAGTSMASLFAQPANLFKPRFWAMLRDIMRFNRDAAVVALGGQRSAQSLGSYLDSGHYSRAFRDWYLLPMAGAIWSCPTETMLAYPFATFARFCHNHGLLQVSNRPQWFTVQNGAREYVRRILATQPDARLNHPVQAVTHAGDGNGVRVTSAGGTEQFDAAVMACHPDQSLALLNAPSAGETSVLSAIRYQPNVAWLHTDTALLPQRRAAWAAWNYLSQDTDTLDQRAVAVTYLINKLQPLPFTTPVMVTLNPFRQPDASKVIQRIAYAHPVFDQAAIAAQQRLPSIQGVDRIWFAGAWCGYGFHEDGAAAGQAAAAQIQAAMPAGSAATPRRAGPTSQTDGATGVPQHSLPLRAAA